MTRPSQTHGQDTSETCSLWGWDINIYTNMLVPTCSISQRAHTLWSVCNVAFWLKYWLSLYLRVHWLMEMYYIGQKKPSTNNKTMLVWFNNWQPKCCVKISKKKFLILSGKTIFHYICMGTYPFVLFLYFFLKWIITFLFLLSLVLYNNLLLSSATN